MYTIETLRQIEAAAGLNVPEDTMDAFSRGRVMYEVFASARKGPFAKTQFTATLHSLTCDYSAGFIAFEHMRKVEVPAMIARATDWLEIEMAKEGGDNYYEVTTPVGGCTVMAKSFVGARFAAGEKLFNHPGRSLWSDDRRSFAAGVKTMPVRLCVGNFRTISEEEANKNAPILSAEEQILVAKRDDWQLRHWLNLAI